LLRLEVTIVLVLLLGLSCEYQNCAFGLSLDESDKPSAIAITATTDKMIVKFLFFFFDIAADADSASVDFSLNVGKWKMPPSSNCSLLISELLVFMVDGSIDVCVV